MDYDYFVKKMEAKRRKLSESNSQQFDTFVDVPKLSSPPKDPEIEDVLKDEKILKRTREMEEFPLESLPAEVLIVIFEHLEIYERLLIERVSKRWQKIAKERSWSKTTRISVNNGICYWLNKSGKFAKEVAELERQRRLLPESEIKVEQFPAIIYGSFVPPEALKWIFHRCGAFVRHIDFSDYEGEEIINILDMLPNLHSLVLNDIHFDNPETQQLIDIACKLPNLKLLRLNGNRMIPYHEIFYPAIGQLLFGLQNLEVLEIADLPGYEFGYLPKSLKRLEISDVYIPFDRLAEWCPELLSLKVSYTIEFVEEVPIFDGLTAYHGLMTKMKLMENLKELEICDLTHHEIAHFPQFLSKLPNLQCFSITLDNDYKQILEVLNKNKPGLQHLSITISEEDFNEEMFPSLDNLKNLRSVIVKSDDCSKDAESVPGFSQFFERLVATHPLEYFETDYILPEASLCSALLKCPTLRRITWNNGGFDFRTLLKKLTEIHRNECPSGEYDKRILHINNPGFGESKNPKHPWLRLHWCYPPNPVTAEIKKLKSVF